MADDNKRNALFSKLFAKDKPKSEPEAKGENATLDELMAFDAENTESSETENTPIADDTSLEEWFSGNMDDNGAVADEDITDAIAELFGEDFAPAEDDTELPVQMLEELPEIEELPELPEEE